MFRISKKWAEFLGFAPEHPILLTQCRVIHAERFAYPATTVGKHRDPTVRCNDLIDIEHNLSAVVRHHALHNIPADVRSACVGLSWPTLVNAPLSVSNVVCAH